MPKSEKLSPTVSLRRLRELKCERCGRLFYAEPDGRQSSRSTDGQPFLCGSCGVTAATPYHCEVSLRSHREQPQATFPAEPMIEQSETSQSCTLDRSLQLKREDTEPSPLLTTAVNAHLQLEGQQSVPYNDKPFACSLCGSRFPSRYVYDEHLCRRAGRPPFLCSACGQTFGTLSSLRFHCLLHDKKHNTYDHPSCHSGAALVKPKTEPSEMALSPDTSQNDNLDGGLQLKPEHPGPSAPASSLPAPLTATVDALATHSAARPLLSKGTDTFPPARAPPPSRPHLAPSSRSPRASPSETQTPLEVYPGHTPFVPFRLTSAFLEVKWNPKLFQERAAHVRKY